jgi:hypothetical protein
MMSACRRCLHPCGDDYSWLKPMEYATSYQCPFGHYFNYHYYSRYDHYQCLRQPILSILDDSLTSTNLKDASSILAHTGPCDGATSSTSFGLTVGCHSLHFIFIIHCHLLKLKKSSIKIYKNMLDLHLGYLTRCC